MIFFNSFHFACVYLKHSKNRKDMGFHTLLSLLMFGYIPYKTKALPIDCGKPVWKCPVEKKEWKLKNDEMKCARNEGYVCMADYKGYLLESCMFNFTVQSNTANCPVVLACSRNRPFLGPVETYLPCPDELQGCPPTNHEGYSIYQLYKYPNCIGSNALSDEERNSTRENKTLLHSTNKPEEQTMKRSKPVNLGLILPLILTAFLLVLAVSIVSIVYLKRKDGNDLFSSYISKEKEPLTVAPPNDMEQLRALVRSCNELEVNNAQFLSSDHVSIDKIYAQVRVHDETEKYDKRNCDIEPITNCAQDEILNANKNKEVRFIFMLGEAGYGKTVECLRITNSWCKAWRNEDYGPVVDSVGNLKEFDLLFIVKMRDVNNRHTSLTEMILDAYSRLQLQKKQLDDILEILEEGIWKSIILLDGLDEWGLPEDLRRHICENAIPNFANIRNSTILITMRSSKFIEVKNICLQRENRVLRLLGLDEKGFMNVTATLVSRLKKIDMCSDAFEDTFERIWGVDSKSLLRKNSFEKNPLLAVFRILSCYEDVKNGPSLTSLYLSFLETLIKKAPTGKRERKNEEHLHLFLSDRLNPYPHLVMNLNALLQFGKIAQRSLSSQGDSLILRKDNLDDRLGTDEYNILFEMGIITPDLLSDDGVKFHFVHETIQEFLASLHLLTEGNFLECFLKKEVTNIEKTFKFSMVLTFLSGLSPECGCIISEHIADLASEDGDICKFREYFSCESYEKVHILYHLQLRCYREVRGHQSIREFTEDGRLSFMFSDIILHGKDTDKSVIRETADILLYHANDIISFQMKFIPNNEQDGITNNELQGFLDTSTSIKSLNIDGYVDRKCRLFHSFNIQMQNLCTLGLHNMAFTGNILAKLLTKDEARKSIKALGLFDIRSGDNLEVGYRYDFLLGKNKHRHFSARSGNEPKLKVCSCSIVSNERVGNYVGEKRKTEPPLAKILKELPSFCKLSTLHVSYMDFVDDRNTLLQVIPLVTTLTHFGYHGNSTFRHSDDNYDVEIINVIMTFKKLEIIFLSDVILNEESLNFEGMVSLEEIKLQDFQISETDWNIIVRSITNLSKIKHLKRILLTDTNITKENINLMKRLSCTLEVVKTRQSSAF